MLGAWTPILYQHVVTATHPDIVDVNVDDGYQSPTSTSTSTSTFSPHGLRSQRAFHSRRSGGRGDSLYSIRTCEHARAIEVLAVLPPEQWVELDASLQGSRGVRWAWFGGQVVEQFGIRASIRTSGGLRQRPQRLGGGTFRTNSPPRVKVPVTH